MSIWEQITFSWCALLIPIAMYGVVDITLKWETRWWILGAWVSFWFPYALFYIWR